MPESDYPSDWPAISARIRARSGGRCECTGECGLHRGVRCCEVDGTDAEWASGRVVLTVAHRNHAPADCRDENLMALCQTCHLRYDTVLHVTNAARARRERRACRDLFDAQAPTVPAP